MTSLVRLGFAAASLAILMFTSSAYADGGHKSKKSHDGGCPGCGCDHGKGCDRNASKDEDDDDDDRGGNERHARRGGDDEQFDIQSHIQEMMKLFRGGRGQGGNGLQDLEKLFQGGKNGRGGEILDHIRKMMEQRGGRGGARRGDEDDEAKNGGDEDEDAENGDDEKGEDAENGDDEKDEDAKNGDDEGNDWQSQARELFDSFRNGGGGGNKGFEDMARRGMEEFQKLPPDARKQIEKLLSGQGGKGAQGMIERFRKMMEQGGGRKGNHKGDEGDEDEDSDGDLL